MYIANYERLHQLSSEDYAGLVCDESSILKSSTGETKEAVVRFATQAAVPIALHGHAFAE